MRKRHCFEREDSHVNTNVSGDAIKLNSPRKINSFSPQKVCIYAIFYFKEVKWNFLNSFSKNEKNNVSKKA